MTGRGPPPGSRGGDFRSFSSGRGGYGGARPLFHHLGRVEKYSVLREHTLIPSRFCVNVAEFLNPSPIEEDISRCLTDNTSGPTSAPRLRLISPNP